MEKGKAIGGSLNRIGGCGRRLREKEYPSARRRRRLKEGKPPREVQKPTAAGKAIEREGTQSQRRREKENPLARRRRRLKEGEPPGEVRTPTTAVEVIEREGTQSDSQRRRRTGEGRKERNFGGVLFETHRFEQIVKKNIKRCVLHRFKKKIGAKRRRTRGYLEGQL